ncbi:Protein tilB [Rhizophlyctis rosea]|uniref:Protein tilB n=1 Tax=Rhizophlyctis rosea TaxID=64517 RepID=A0AAD5SL40_9FUNG|nr:Protein tilB [Rhizophlyctis rosea]
MAQRIDRDLLRKRAEHNDGDLSTLREITLHQFDIEKIENLDTNCRHLEILFLQNNQISKIENLHKMKELQYLQLALNNITVLENLEGCESLRKLDLTVNFIEDPLDVESLRSNEQLRELYLVGNPCTQKEGYREFVITALPQLKLLDGREIEKSERILAQQIFPAIRERFLSERAARQAGQAEYNLTKADVEAAVATAAEKDCSTTDAPASRLEATRRRFQSQTTSHTPEARLQAARDVAIMKEGKKPTPKEDPRKAFEVKANRLFAPDGRVLQRNEGKWLFMFHETPDTIVLEVEINKFLDTSLIDVDVHPTWVRVVIKGKILQLVLDEEVKTDDVICERSTASGHLCLTMLKLKSQKSGDVVEIRRKEREATERQKKEEAKRAAEGGSKQRNRRYERLFEPSEAVDIHTIVGAPGKKPIPNRAIGRERKQAPSANAAADVPDDFEDDPDVPPLC